MDITTQSIKQRFGIIGNHFLLNRSIEKALRVAPTDISVLVTGESGVGKESQKSFTNYPTGNTTNILL